jgi:hypothetical protein
VILNDPTCPTSGSFDLVFEGGEGSTDAYHDPAIVDYFELQFPDPDDPVDLPIYQKDWWSH